MSEESDFLKLRKKELEMMEVRADSDDVADGVVEVPVGVYLEKSPQIGKKARMRQMMKDERKRLREKARKADDDDEDDDDDAQERDYGDDEDEEKDGSEEDTPQKKVTPKKRGGKLLPGEEYEEGEDILPVKTLMPRFEGGPGLEDPRDVLTEMPEFWGFRLEKVPYIKRKVKKGKLGHAAVVKMKRTKYGLVPQPRRSGLTPPLIGPEGEDFLYEEIPEDEMEEAVEAYKKEYAEKYGGEPEDVPTPYLTPRRIVDFTKKTTQEILEICRERKLKCNTLVKEVASRYEEGDEDKRDAAIRSALISRIENSLRKAAVAPRRPFRGYFPATPPTGTPSPRRTKPNPYNSKYTRGTRVSFVDTKGIARQGVVKEFAKPGITVMADRMEFKIKYTNKSLKIVTKKERSTAKLAGKQEAAIYGMTDIPRSLRERIVEVYVELLKEITATDAPKSNSPSTKVAEFSLTPPVPWEEYYEGNFHAWRWQMFSGQIYNNLDHEAIDKYVKEESEKNKDYQTLIEIVLGNLENEITTETNAEDVIRAFNIIQNERHLTPFESAFMENFQRLYNTRNIEEEGKLGMGKYRSDKPYEYIELNKYRKKEEEKSRKSKWKYQKKATPEELKPPRTSQFPEPAKVPEIKGLDLAKMIETAIREYIMIVPSLDRQLIIDEEIRKGLESMDQDTLRSMFDKEQLAGMKKLHAEYEIFYREEYEKYQNALEEAQAKGEMNDIDATKIAVEVKKFEEIVYLNHGRGKNVYVYLKHALIPYIFMHGPIAKHAKFFRAKLANGMYQFSALAAANVAHYLPEFVMGIQDHSEAEIDALFREGPWVTLALSLRNVMHLTMRTFMDSYISILHPTRRKEMSNIISRLWEAGDPLVKILVSPVSACQSQTGTGQRPVIRNDAYVYDIMGKGTGKSHVHQMENIPEGDLVICFSNGKFTCRSVRDIAIAIIKAGKKKPVDVHGKPYPVDFIERFKHQHADVLKKISVPSESGKEEPLPKTPSPVKRTPAPKAKKEKKRHVPVRGKKFKKVTGLLLIGDSIEVIPSTLPKLKIPLEASSKDPQKKKTLVLTFETEHENANVAIISFDADSEPDIETLAEAVGNVPDEITDIYILGVGAGLLPKTKVIYTTRIKKIKDGRVKGVFYSDGLNQEDVIDSFVDIVIDVEGIKVRGKESPKKKAGKKSDYDPSKAAEDYAPFWTPEGGWRYSEKDEEKRPSSKRKSGAKKAGKTATAAKRIRPKIDPEIAKWEAEFEKIQRSRKVKPKKVSTPSTPSATAGLIGPGGVRRKLKKSKKAKVRTETPNVATPKPKIVKKTKPKTPSPKPTRTTKSTKKKSKRT